MIDQRRPWTAQRLVRSGLAAALVVLLVGGGYLLVWSVVGRMTGSQTATAAVLATAVAALLFLPVHLFVGWLVYRLMRRGQPTLDSVLADITERSRSTSTDAPNLAGVAEAIARGLSANSCRLTVIHPGLRDRTYAWTDGDAVGDAGGYAGGHADDVVLPIRMGTDVIGSIAVDRAAVTGRHAGRRRLLDNIASSLGTILQVSRLGIELERQLRAALAHAEDIAASRRQAVAERDSERRTIERNLHDGAQHHLVSLRLTMGLLEHEIGCGEYDQARERLGQIATQIDTAQAVLAETAAGVSSIMLSQRGLVAALNADLSGSHPPIVVVSQADLSGRRFPPQVEAAVYFCCLEAVGNARKHAPGAAVKVQICEVDGTLRFTVRDDGPGFAAGSVPSQGSGASSGGRGLRNVTDRIMAVGGTISIHSTPGVGTTIEGSVPVAPPMPPKAQPMATAGTAAPEQSVLGQVRAAVREARELYDGSAESKQLRELQARLDEPIVGPAQGGDAQRAEMLKARAALQELEAMVRSSPSGSERATVLSYQLERIRTGADQLTEIDLIDELRSGTLPLTDDERRVAEELLGASGAQPWARLGLEADADTGEVRRAAQAALARWQHRASHPASTRAVRNVAEALVRACEELLAKVDTQ